MAAGFEVKILAPRAKGTAVPGSLLSDVLLEAGLPLSLYCGGRGICGKCRVRIVRGEVSPAGKPEARRVEGKAAGTRLAGSRARPGGRRRP